MTLRELTDRWAARRAEWARLGVVVDGAKLAEEVLADLAALEHAASSEAVTLTEASLIGGYSIDHLQRLVATRQLENVGRKGRPRIRRSEVPRKPGYLPPSSAGDQFTSRRQIVAAVRITEHRTGEAT